MLLMGLLDKSRSLEVIWYDYGEDDGGGGDDDDDNDDDVDDDDNHLSWGTWENEYPGINFRLLWLKGILSCVCKRIILNLNAEKG